MFRGLYERAAMLALLRGRIKSQKSRYFGHVARHPSLQNSITLRDSVGSSVAEWLACCTQAQKGPGSNRSRDAVGLQS